MTEKESSPTSSATQAANPLTRKLNKILDTRLENDKELLEAVKALSTFFTENSLRTRRSLRSNIERRSLSINEDFISSFRAVKEELDSAYDDVKAMNDCCRDMTNRLKTAKEQTHDLLNQTTSLRNESQNLQMKARVADVFLDRFQLTSAEVKILRGTRDAVLNQEFFKLLARVKQIHTDCKILLRTNQQTAGLEIMESMALHQESAYERLYRWTQNECRLLTGDSAAEISPILCQAMQAIQDRPVLFKYSLDEYGTARRTAVVRSLIDALTRGGVGGTPRPIELHSHDPLRYVGDILAWLHQTSASEKEHLQSLVKRCTCKDDEVQDVLDHITEGVCRAVKVRIEQVVVGEQDAVTLYKLTSILKFYQSTIGQILHNEAALVKTLDEMHILSRKMFFNSLTCHANKLLDKVELPPSDLAPTSSLTRTLALLKDILTSHDSSVVPIDERKHDFRQIIACVIEPVLHMCSMSASHLSTTDMAAYMINCIYQIQTTLTVYEFTDEWVEMLQAQIDAHMDTLVSEQASLVLTRVSLVDLYTAIQNVPQSQQQHAAKSLEPLSSMKAMDTLTLKASMLKFDSFLANPDSLLLPQALLLLSATVRETTKRHAMDLICTAYKHMYDAINKPANGYTEPQSIAPRTPDQVVRLLS